MQHERCVTHININVMKQKVAKNNKEINEMEQMIKIKQRQIEKKIQDI